MATLVPIYCVFSNWQMRYEIGKLAISHLSSTLVSCKRFILNVNEICFHCDCNFLVKIFQAIRVNVA